MYVALTRAMGRLYLPCVLNADGEPKPLRGPYDPVNRRVAALMQASDPMLLDRGRGRRGARSGRCTPPDDAAPWTPAGRASARNDARRGRRTRRSASATPRRVVTSYTRLRGERAAARARPGSSSPRPSRREGRRGGRRPADDDAARRARVRHLPPRAARARAAGVLRAAAGDLAGVARARGRRRARSTRRSPRTGSIRRSAGTPSSSSGRPTRRPSRSPAARALAGFAAATAMAREMEFVYPIPRRRASRARGARRRRSAARRPRVRARLARPRVRARRPHVLRRLEERLAGLVRARGARPARRGALRGAGEALRAGRRRACSACARGRSTRRASAGCSTASCAASARRAASGRRGPAGTRSSPGTRACAPDATGATVTRMSRLAPSGTARERWRAIARRGERAIRPIAGADPGRRRAGLLRLGDRPVRRRARARRVARGGGAGRGVRRVDARGQHAPAAGPAGACVGPRCRGVPGAVAARARPARAGAFAASGDPVTAVIGLPGERKPLIVDGEWLYAERMHALEERFCARIRERAGRGGGALEGRALTRAVAAVAGGPPPLTTEQQRAVREALGDAARARHGGARDGQDRDRRRAPARDRVDGHAHGADRHRGAHGQGRAAARRRDRARARAVARPRGRGPRCDRARAADASSPARVVTVARALRATRERPAAPSIRRGRRGVDDRSGDDGPAGAGAPARRALVLLGDADQLPSIEAGAVFRDLCAGLGAVRLSINLRVANDPNARRITEAARAVNAGVVDARFAEAVTVRRSVDEVTFEGVEHLAARGSDVGAALLDRWWRARIAVDPRAAPRAARAPIACATGSSTRTIGSRSRGSSITTRGRGCCASTRVRGFSTSADAINDRLLARLREETGARRAGRRGGELCPGAPVSVQRNDYDRGLYNGDQGVVVRVDRRTAGAQLDGGLPARLEVRRLPPRRSRRSRARLRDDRSQGPGLGVRPRRPGAARRRTCRSSRASSSTPP